MTLDAAEKAGVPVVAYRTDIFESLPNGKLSRLILDVSEVSNADPDWTALVPASALDTARAEIERLRGLIREDPKTILIAYEDGVHMRLSRAAADATERALTAESALTAAQERIAELEALAKEGRRAIGEHFAPSDCYATGPLTGDPHRDLVECPACSFVAMFDATLSPAVKEPK